MAIFTQGKAAFYTEADSLYKNATDPAKSKVVRHRRLRAVPGRPGRLQAVQRPVLGARHQRRVEEQGQRLEVHRSGRPARSRRSRSRRPACPAPAPPSGPNPEGTATYPKDLAEAIAVSTKTGVGHDRPLVVKVAEAREIVGQPIVDAITGKDAAGRRRTRPSRRSRSSSTTRQVDHARVARARPAPATRPVSCTTRSTAVRRHPPSIARPRAMHTGLVALGQRPPQVAVRRHRAMVFVGRADRLPGGAGPAYLSLTDAEGSVRAESEFVGLGNYLDVLSDTDRFWPAVLARPSSSPGSRCSSRSSSGWRSRCCCGGPFRGEKWVRVAILLPLVATPVAVGMMWRLIFDPNIGLANQMLGWVGIPPQPWLAGADSALPTHDLHRRLAVDADGRADPARRADLAVRRAAGGRARRRCERVAAVPATSPCRC